MTIRKLPRETLYASNDPKNFYSEMRRDVTILAEHRSYTSLTTIIVCCLDALAAGSGEASSPKFEAFVTGHFPDLCTELEKADPARKGSRTLYDKFRNGFAHLRGPKRRFAIAEDHELNGAWVGQVEVESIGYLIALNVDRLAREFLILLDRLEAGST